MLMTAPQSVAQVFDFADAQIGQYLQHTTPAPRAPSNVVPLRGASTPPNAQRYIEVTIQHCPGLKRRKDTISGHESWVLRYTDPLSRQRTSTVIGHGAEMDEYAAVAYARQLRKDLKTGRSPRAGSMPLEVYFDQHYLPKMRGVKRSWLDDRGRFNASIRQALGKRTLASLTTRDLRVFVDAVRSGVYPSARVDRLSDGSINQITALLKAIFREAVQLGSLESSPAQALRLLKLNNLRHVVYSAEEIARILTALREINVQVALLFALLLATGARIGEILATLHADLDLVNGVLHLRHTKSGRPMAMPLSESALAICREQLDMARPGNAHLFPAARGTGPMAPPRKAFQAVLSQLGIRNRTFHDARRTAITLAAHAPGVGLLAASRMANHASTRITETRYVVTSDARVRLAVDAVSRSLPLHLGMRPCMALRPRVCSQHIDARVRFVTARLP